MIARTRKIMRSIVYKSLNAMYGDTDGLITLTTLRGPAKGLRFKLDFGRSIEPAYWLGSYDQNILFALSNIVQPGWVVWDCGIYLGYYTAFFARLVGANGQVVAFEPDPYNLARAKHNTALNGYSNVQFVHAAVGSPLEVVDFIVSKNSNSHLPNVYIGSDRQFYSSSERRDELIKVRSISLDEALADPEIPAPDLIKIDIEGAELNALRFVNSLVRTKRPLLVLELHNPECDSAAWEFAAHSDYELYSLDERKRIQDRSEVHGTLLCTPK